MGPNKLLMSPLRGWDGLHFARSSLRFGRPIARRYASQEASVIKIIEESWGWIGIKPAEIVGENDFGNLIVRDVLGKYWRLCPEDLYCKVVAENREQLDSLSKSQDFLADWYMSSLAGEANTQPC